MKSKKQYPVSATSRVEDDTKINFTTINEGLQASVLSEETVKRYRTNQGYVYLVHAVGTSRYKIGQSTQPKVRFEQLKNQSPFPLEVIDCFWTPDRFADEKALHEELGHTRVHSEWFELFEKKSDRHPDFENIEGFRSWYFSAGRPEINKISEALTKSVLPKIWGAISTAKVYTKDYFKPENLPWDIKGEICRALAKVESLEQIIRLCYFVENDWTPTIEFSLNTSTLIPFGVELSYLWARIAIISTFQGFMASLLQGGIS
jgi:hypothetical protein